MNPFTADLEVVIDERFDANSATAWYLAADPSVIDTIEYSFLEGEEGPQKIFTCEGVDADGLEVKVRHIGAGVIDHRRLVTNVGV